MRSPNFTSINKDEECILMNCSKKLLCILITRLFLALVMLQSLLSSNQILRTTVSPSLLFNTKTWEIAPIRRPYIEVLLFHS